MEPGIIIFIAFLVLLLVVYFVDGYNQKLTIEKDKQALASSFVNLYVEPKLRPRGPDLSRVTVYDNLIVAKHIPTYPGKYNPGHDVVDLDSGISTFTHKPVIKFLADRQYRFGHIIPRDSIISCSISSGKSEVGIKYKNADDQIYTLTIKKPYLLTSSYKNLIEEINKFASTKTSKA